MKRKHGVGLFGRSALLALVLVAGCDGLSDVGERDAAAPQAVFTAVGYAAGGSGDGGFAIDVRGGAEVLLSGRASVSDQLPIVAYRIEPLNDAARAAPFTVRSTDSIAVVVPPGTPDGEPLRYRLTVTDGGGQSDSAEARLNIVAARDGDGFLQYRNRSAHFTVIAATDQPDTAAGDFTLRLKSRVRYAALDGTYKTAEFDLLRTDDARALRDCGAPAVLQPAELAVRNGAWTAGPPVRDAQGEPVAAALDADHRHPRFRFPVPAFDVDRITRLYQANLRDPAAPDLIGCLPDPGRVDEAQIEVDVLLDAPTLQSRGRLFLAEHHLGAPLAVPAVNDGSGASTVLTIGAEAVETLRLVGGGLENKDTARAYYAAIDPQSRKTTLDAWLRLNCFDPEAADYAADVHAVYANNFDLGFGRDMYLRTRSCDADGAATARTASVVVNYPTVEAAAKRVGAFLAVAMEYIEHADPAQPGTVTFYTFAPNPSAPDRASGFTRVLSANFDGRGEKYMPGSCTTCHGGAPALPDLAEPLQTYARSAAHSGGRVGATFMPWDLQSFLFVDSPSAPAIVPDAGLHDTLRARFTRQAQEDAFRRLNQAAYHTYGHRSVNDVFTCFEDFAGPCGLVEKWYGGENLPSPVFIDDAPGNVPEGWSGSEADIALYNEVFARHCRACHVQRVSDTPVSGRDPQFASASEFLQAAELHATMFGDGSMPGARLTADRLWQSVGGARSAGSRLAEALGEDPQRMPGAVRACADGLDPSAGNTAARDRVFALGSECSEFAAQVEWTLLARPPGSATQIAGATAAQAALVPDRSGTYRIRLQATGSGGVGTDAAEYRVEVPNLLPQSVASIERTALVGVATRVDVLAAAAALGDAPVRVEIDRVLGPLTAVVEEGRRLRVTASALQDGEVIYAIVDADGERSSGQLRVRVVDEALVANPLTLSVVSNSQGDLATGLNVVDLGEAVSSALPGSALRFELRVPPGLPGPGQVTGAAQLGAECVAVSAGTACRLAYTPPPGVTSHFENRRVGPDDTLAYRVCRVDAPGVCADASLTVSLHGRFGFAPVAAAMVAGPGAAGCNAGGCHAPTANPDPSWGIPATASEKEAWCSLREGNGYKTGTNENGAQLVVPGDALASLMFTKPQVLVPHRGTFLAGDQALYDAMHHWIAEGAYYTGAAGRSDDSGQTCP